MSTTLPNPRAQGTPTRLVVALPALSERHPLRVLAGICVLGAVLFAATLNGSSLFIDEVFSWSAAHGSMDSLVDAVRYAEVTPPLYYLILHGWIAVAGDSELMMRLPSALAGVALIAATSWFGWAVAGRRAGLAAAVLTALSPLVFAYAQQVRAYIFAMVVIAVAAAAVVEWTRQPHRTRWPTIAVVAIAAAVLLHYTSALVLVPLVVWTATRAELPRRSRLLFVVVCALPGLALLPLLAFQTAQGHQSGTAEYARITVHNLFALFGTPFDGRSWGAEVGRMLGALVVAEALALLALAQRFRTTRARGLLIAASTLPVLAVLITSAFAQPIAITRYTAVAAPFMIVAVAVVVVALPRLLGMLLGGLAVTACVIGLVAAMLGSGQYPDTRAAVSQAGVNWQPGDQIFGLGYLGFDGSLDYYVQRDVPGAEANRQVKGFASLGAALDSEAGRDALADGRRMWFVTDPAIAEPDMRRVLRSVGYAPLESREYTGTARVQLILAGPRS